AEVAAPPLPSPATPAVQPSIYHSLPLPAANTPLKMHPVLPQEEMPVPPSAPPRMLPPPTLPSLSTQPERSAASLECAALPFLLLGPLSQIGLLDILGGSFIAAQRCQELQTLAAGLALKVLPPPERGWRHQPEQLASAAAFAGLAEFPDELASLAGQQLEDVLSPVESAVAQVVLNAHTVGKPLVAE